MSSHPGRRQHRNLPDVFRVVRQLEEAVAEAADELLVVVAGAEHEAAVVGEPVQGVQQVGLVGDRAHGPGQLVQDGPVQALVDVVEGQTKG